MTLEGDYDSFREAWKAKWDDTEKTIKSKYDNLRIMTEIKPGDYIIVPKISEKANEDYVCRSFIIAKCKCAYQFDVLEKVDDFGHYIEVSEVFSCGYNKDLDAQNIAKMFRSYQSPLNRVKSEGFIESVNKLVQLHKDSPEQFEVDSKNLLSMISSATKESRSLYLNSIKESLQKLDNHKFEDIIAELFEQNGYSLAGRNWYNKEGGDIDVYFECFNKNTLMNDVYEICDVKMPHIYVQAKKKTGIDSEDVIAVEQLKLMKKHITEKNAILMVINLADKFTTEAQEEAADSGVILINGITFASLLVRYGIEVDIV